MQTIWISYRPLKYLNICFLLFKVNFYSLEIDTVYKLLSGRLHRSLRFYCIIFSISIYRHYLPTYRLCNMVNYVSPFIYEKRKSSFWFCSAFKSVDKITRYCKKKVTLPGRGRSQIISIYMNSDNSAIKICWILSYNRKGPATDTTKIRLFRG